MFIKYIKNICLFQDQSSHAKEDISLAVRRKRFKKYIFSW